MMRHGQFAPIHSRTSNWLVALFALIVIPSEALNAKDKTSREPTEITITSPQAFTLTQPFIAQIQARRHIKIRSLEKGYLWRIAVKDGEEVKQDDPLCRVIAIRDQKKLDWLGADTIRAPLDGIVDHLRHQQGSLIEEGEILTTMSDDSVMRVYFNMPKARYLEYVPSEHKGDLKIELLLTSGKKFDQLGNIGEIEGPLNNQIENIAIHADFPNPDHQLHHDETGIVLITRVQKDALVIPQRAVLEDGGKRYVYVVDKDNVAHRREIVVRNASDDLFVIQEGAIGPDDRIVLNGVQYVGDGEKVKCKVSRSKDTVLSASVI